MTARLAGWEARLGEVIAREHSRDDYPGRCVDFLRRAVEALYGCDPLPDWRARFPVGAIREPDACARMIADGIADCAARFGWSRCQRAAVRDGFIAVVHPPHIMASGLMLVVGAKLLRTVPTGLHAMRLTLADEFWGD